MAVTEAISKDDELKGIFDYLKEFSEDSTVPRNVRTKVNNVVEILKGDEDVSIKVNRALDELEELANDGNIQAFTRTQIWNVVSMLENLE